jgi:hypothetical protein
MLGIQCGGERPFFSAPYAYRSMEAVMSLIGIYRIKKPEGIEDGVWVKAGTSFEIPESHYVESAYQPPIGDLPWGVSTSEKSPSASWAEPAPEWASRSSRD